MTTTTTTTLFIFKLECPENIAPLSCGRRKQKQKQRNPATTAQSIDIVTWNVKNHCFDVENSNATTIHFFSHRPHRVGYNNLMCYFCAIEIVSKVFFFSACFAVFFSVFVFILSAATLAREYSQLFFGINELHEWAVARRWGIR